MAPTKRNAFSINIHICGAYSPMAVPPISSAATSTDPDRRPTRLGRVDGDPDRNRGRARAGARFAAHDGDNASRAGRGDRVVQEVLGHRHIDMRQYTKVMTAATGHAAAQIGVAFFGEPVAARVMPEKEKRGQAKKVRNAAGHAIPARLPGRDTGAQDQAVGK